jgi:hypothetical protein
MPYPTQLVLACAAMAMLSGMVVMRLLQVRVNEMKARRIDMQEISNSLEVSARLQSVQASDNFKNLFEMPVLFYALCAVLLATGQASSIFVAGAWAYVALRYAHSLIQCTYNSVAHRFAAFMGSTLLLLAMWAQLAWQAVAPLI